MQARYVDPPLPADFVPDIDAIALDPVRAVIVPDAAGGSEVRAFVPFCLVFSVCFRWLLAVVSAPFWLCAEVCGVFPAIVCVFCGFCLSDLDVETVKRQLCEVCRLNPPTHSKCPSLSYSRSERAGVCVCVCFTHF